LVHMHIPCSHFSGVIMTTILTGSRHYGYKKADRRSGLLEAVDP